jgi:D-serine deaminase-like pyridoxal phosphate-dependent protein
MLFNHNRPTLLIDKEKVLKNISRFQKIAQQNNAIFRPHFKTHQSKEIGNWFRDFGIEKITVSSVNMAQYFADDDWKDILIAFPLNIHEIETITQLSKKINLQLTISSLEHIEALKHSTITNVNIYIKIDTGYNRSGIELGDITKIHKILESLKNNNFKFIGFLSHFGHVYNTNSSKEIDSIYSNEIQLLQNLKLEAQSFFPNSIISIGDTPGLSQVENFKGIDEIRPGNFVFYDCMQENLGACYNTEIAVALACPIIEVNANQKKIVVYGGAIHLSKESIIKSKLPFFGAIVRFENKKWSSPIDEIYVKSLSQEHGIIHCPNEKIDSFKIGDIIGILPVHSCLTANLMKGYFDFDGNYIDHLNKFV